MSRFTSFPTFKTLKALAERPIDLTDPTVYTPQRIERCQASALGWRLFFAGERVDDEALEALATLAREAGALERMGAMQRGEVVNLIEGYPSENRPALHTAMRDIFEEPPLAPAASEQARRELKKLKRFLDRDLPFSDIVQVGIGGSDLGPRALAIALDSYRIRGRRAHFVSNVDPDDAAAVLEQLDLRNTAVVVVSKSGSTLETLTNETFLRRAFEKAGLDPRRHFIAVTGKNSPMDDPARYLEAFHMWDFVGGRYSATSMVGAVTLAFLIGYDRFLELLEGAHEMDRHALTPDPRRNLPLLSALLRIWNRNFLRSPTVAVIPYAQALSRFPAHLQQLEMESNGKQIDRGGERVDFATAPVIWGEPGTNGQHSFYQMLHQGTDIVPLEFIGFLHPQRERDEQIEGTSSQQKLLANLLAQSLALSMGQKSRNPNQQFDGNRPNRLFLADKLTPKTVGSLLSLYEHKVAFQGFIWQINSFDQEGVQLGKKLATQFLSLFKGEQGSFPLGEAYDRELFKKS
jgi:glucose-6-phosphate isomerase